MDCYIRHQGSYWVPGKSHHREALEKFIRDRTSDVSVSHSDEGYFKASFSHLSSYNSKDLYQYVDEYDNKVEIMICEPGFAAYINRIVS